MGRMSFSITVGGCFLGSGTTVAVFHKSGSTPSRSELLYIAAKGRDKIWEKSLSIHGGMLSGPVALLILVLSRAASVSSTVIVNSAGSCSVIWNMW